VSFNVGAQVHASNQVPGSQPGAHAQIAQRAQQDVPRARTVVALHGAACNAVGVFDPSEGSGTDSICSTSHRPSADESVGSENQYARPHHDSQKLPSKRTQAGNAMNKHLVAYLAAAVVMVAIDMLWLGLVAKTMYQQAIGHLMADQPNVAAAGVFYALYALGLMLFAVAPHADAADFGKTMVMGALLGLFAYATYDLSNLATLRNWPVGLTVIDIAWGTVLSAVTAGAAKAAMHWSTS